MATTVSQGAATEGLIQCMHNGPINVAGALLCFCLVWREECLLLAQQHLCLSLPRMSHVLIATNAHTYSASASCRAKSARLLAGLLIITFYLFLYFIPFSLILPRVPCGAVSAWLLIECVDHSLLGWPDSQLLSHTICQCVSVSISAAVIRHVPLRAPEYTDTGLID